MLIFIDDSGDPGFKLNKGSSSHFVIACVIFDTYFDAEKTSVTIKKVRKNIGWQDYREFKFNKTNKVVRLQFFNSVAVCRFRVRAVIVDKSVLHKSYLNNDKTFYNYVIKELLARGGKYIKAASIRIDGRGDRAYKKEVTSYIRKSASFNSSIKDIRFVDSTTDNLIQLADMVAGAIMRTTTTKTDSNAYFTILRAQLEDVWYF